MPKKSIQDNNISVPAFTQGINALLKCATSIVPRMEWMSNLVRNQIDPLNSLPPVVRETLLQLPQIAWPTILLSRSEYVMYALCCWVTRIRLDFVCTATGVILTCCMFVMFTVAHRRSPWVCLQRFQTGKWNNWKNLIWLHWTTRLLVAWKWIGAHHHKPISQKRPW